VLVQKKSENNLACFTKNTRENRAKKIPLENKILDGLTCLLRALRAKSKALRACQG